MAQCTQIDFMYYEKYDVYTQQRESCWLYKSENIIGIEYRIFKKYRLFSVWFYDKTGEYFDRVGKRLAVCDTIEGAKKMVFVYEKKKIEEDNYLYQR